MTVGIFVKRYKWLLMAILFWYTPDARAQFYTVQTENLRLIYYQKEHSYIIPHLTRCFENSYQFHHKLFDFSPTDDVLIFLQDFDDYGYAGATSVPANYIVLGIEPYEYVYETCPTNERFNWTTSHELTHIVAMDKASSGDRLWRSMFFGKVAPTSDDPVSMVYSYLTTPRRYCPRWYHEGIAVFMETWMAGGIGRVLGGYDEMVFRTMVHDSSYFYDFVGLESEGTTIDFQIGANSYLYGTRFVSYLAYTYGPEKVLKWFSRTDSSDAYYASQFERVYGVTLDDEWSRWVEWEHRWQEANFDSIRLYPVTPYRPLSKTPLGAVSKAFFDKNEQKLYLGVDYPGSLGYIGSLDLRSGKMSKICGMTSPSLYNVCSIAYDDSAKVIFYTTHNSKGWRDLNAVNLKTGESKLLIANARIGDLAFNNADKSLWGIRHHDGLSRIVRLQAPYLFWEEVVPLSYGTDLFNLDISPNGSALVGTMMDISGKQQLIRIDLDTVLNGRMEYEKLYEFENNAPEHFVYSPDGRYLFGTTYYTGVSNVVRYDFESKTVDWMSNCETGFFRPIPVSPDSLIVFRYTGKGFTPAMIASRVVKDVSAIRYLGQGVVEKYPVVKEWKLKPPSPSNINIDSLIVSSGDYNAFSNLGVISAYPIVKGYKNVAAFGMKVEVADALLLHDFDLSLLYSPNRSLPINERFHGSFTYKYWQWTLGVTHNDADFYDLFGPTKTSRKGSSISVRYGDYLINKKPEVMDYAVVVHGYSGLERLPDYQNISTSYDRFLTLDARLTYSHQLRSLGAVDYEGGSKWSVNFQSPYVQSEFFPRLYATYDVGTLLPIEHSSIWVRSSVGYSFVDKDNPFANFYFGGFGNNWVDYGEEKRYREYYSFPGVDLNDIGGVNFGKLLVEWDLPPIRFRRLGVPTIYCNWARIALFSSGVTANIDNHLERRSVIDAGGQIDFKLVIFSSLESTLSCGYAFAMEKDESVSRELMVSLKILK